MQPDFAPAAGTARRCAATPARTLAFGISLFLLAVPGAAGAQVVVSVFASDDSAAETPPDDGEFVVRRVGGDADGPVTVRYTVGGSATPGADYDALAGSLTLGAGQSEMAIPVHVTGDDGLLEGDESVMITLLPEDGGGSGGDDGDGGDGGGDGGDGGDDGSGGEGSGGVDVADATATVTIRDSEHQVTVSGAGDAAENPPAEGRITISLGVRNESGSALDVRYEVGGSATPSIDYVALSGAATIATGESSTTVVITPIDDELVEGEETVAITLTGTGSGQVGVGSPESASVSIADNDPQSGGDGDDDDDGSDGDGDGGDDDGDDGGGDGDGNGDGGDGGNGDGDDDPAPVEVSIAASDDSAAETPRDPAEFVVRRVGGDPDRDVRIDYTVGGSATPRDDYKALSGRVNLKRGDLEAAIRVDPSKDDRLLEGNETVTVTLAEREGDVIVVDGTASVTIRDSSHAVRVEVDENAAEPASTGRFTLVLDATNASGEPLGVQYSVAGIATPGSDYRALSGEAVIGSDASSASITVTPVDDDTDEPDETVVVTLTDTSHPDVTLGSPASASLTVADDDAPAGDDDGGNGDDDGDDDGDDGGNDGGGTGDQGSADPDGDGLSNDDEAVQGTDPARADTDGDGIGDGDEVAAGTDPLDELSFADADGDLVPDAVEAANGSDPGDGESFPDGDRGGTPDHVEAVLFAAFGLPPTSPADPADDGRDFDGDGLPDRLELLVGTDALSADAPTASGASDPDGDGITQAVEDWLGTLHIDDVDRTSDRDRDGYPDAAEVSLGLDPLAASARDADADGVPDVVEALAGVDADGTTDTDGDGVPDAREIALGSDMLDANSPVANGASDDDADGISNAIEAVLRLLGAAEDAAAEDDGDGDGIADADEIRSGTDPRHDEQPAAWIELAQGDTGGVNALLAGGGGAVARARVGGHQAGTLTWDWSGSSDAVLAVSTGAQDTSRLAFSPQTLPPGAYTLSVRVRRSVGDYSSPESSVEFPFVVLEDGSQASVADADGDGVPDSGDGADARAGLAHELESGSGGRMRAEPGVRLQLGPTARTARTGSARVTLENIAAHGDGRGESVDNGADEFSYPGGLYDFEIANLPEAGASATVVIPLGVGIGELPEYRKFQPGRGWDAFVEDDRNAIASAPGGADPCPAPGDDAYEPGLTPGDLCVELTIEDGGPNDADAELGPNGLIRDPGGVAAPEGSVTVGQGSGRTDTVTLVLLGLAALIAAARRYQRRTRPVSRCTKSDSW